MSGCPGCGDEDARLYSTYCGVPGPSGMGLAPVIVHQCVDCHSRLPSRPPYDTPPRICGRATGDGTPCRNEDPDGATWQACHLHEDAPWPDPEEIPPHKRAEWVGQEINTERADV